MVFKAIGVDVGYSSIELMAKKYITQPIPANLEKIKTKFKKRVTNCKTYKEARETIQNLRQTRAEEFCKIFEKHRNNYIVSSCFQIPFKDNYFDLCVSVELLGHKDYFSNNQTLKGINELKRVAKEVRIYSHSLTSNISSIELKQGKITAIGKHLLIIK